MLRAVGVLCLVVSFQTMRSPPAKILTITRRIIATRVGEVWQDLCDTFAYRVNREPGTAEAIKQPPNKDQLSL